ncbi:MULTISPECIES: hypothetical protein [unclassified Pseudoalteromonas]|uniref:hypothetical protein n=1 Tax=unclassified Pseudoalteromonas TaxID=194690 RepID=UPI00301459E8
MKTMVSSLFAMALFASSAAVANSELNPAPADLIQELTEMCLDWAKEDEVQTAELKSYVLNCVNDELEASGYDKVTDVDIK